MGNVLVTQVLLVLHVIAAAYQFGASAGQPRRIRQLLELAPEDAKKLAPGMKKEGVFIGLSAVVVLVTGLGLIFNLGGFGVVHPRIHASLGLAVVWIGIGAGLIRPNAMAIIEAAERGEPLAPLAGRTKKIAAGQGIAHLLFFVILTLMLWRM